MKTKKSRLWKRSMALVLGFMMLLPSVALAEDTDASDNLPKTEAVQIDLNAEIEEALQEDSNLEDGPQVTIGGKEEDVSGNDSFESEKEISPRGVDYPVTELYIIGVRGASDGEKTSETVNCGKNIHIASDASKETRNFYDKSTALTITLQFYGTHLLSQKTTITGDIHMTGSSPYDYVLGPNGGIKNYKMDYVLTPRDKQAEQTVFDISYIAYMSDGVHTYPGRYHRTLTINWGDALSDIPAPTSPYIIYNDPSSYAVLCGVDSSMEYQWAGDTSWTQCTTDRIPLPSTTKVLKIRYRATGDTGVSQAKKIELKQPGAMPSISLNRYTGKITGLTDEMEMKYDKGAWGPIPDEVFENGAASYMEKLSYGEKVWLAFRYKATENAPASIGGGWDLLPFVADAPSSVAYDPLTTRVTGINNTMEYSYNLTTWYDVGNYSALNFYASLDYQVGATIYVRTKATDERPASMYKKLVMPGLSRPAPTGITVTYDELNNQYVLHNLVGGQQYDYSIMRSMLNYYYFTAASSGDKVVRDDYAQDGESIYLRLRQTETEGPSACVKIDLPKNVGDAFIPTSEIDLPGTENTAETYVVSPDTMEVLVVNDDFADDVVESNYLWEKATKATE